MVFMRVSRSGQRGLLLNGEKTLVFPFRRQNRIMDTGKIRSWAFFFTGILAAIVAADALSRFLISRTGLNGGAGFIAGFVLYAVLFFGILTLIERVTGIRFFGSAGERD